MKKLSIALSVVLLSSISLSACDFNFNKDVTPSLSPQTTVSVIKEQYHEERSGYKFCGYFEDEKLTKRVTQEVKKGETEKYYAKYQPDTYAISQATPIDMDWTFYAGDMMGAICMYMWQNYEKYFSLQAMRMPDYSRFGVPFSRVELILNETNGEPIKGSFT